MVYKIYLIAVLMAVPTLIIAQDDEGTTPADDPPSVIKGPLVTTTAESFIDTVLVRLQSMFYNNNRFQLDTHTESATVLGVDLIIRLDGELSVVQDMVESRIVSGGGNIVDFDMTVKNLLVEKRYSVTSVQDPLYASNGSVVLSVDGALFHTSISVTQKPYFVDSVRYLQRGTMNTTVIGEGIPLAEEIQDTLQELVITEYNTEDNSKYFGEVYKKLNQIFDNDEIILCTDCTQLSTDD